MLAYESPPHGCQKNILIEDRYSLVRLHRRASKAFILGLHFVGPTEFTSPVMAKIVAVLTIERNTH